VKTGQRKWAALFGGVCALLIGVPALKALHPPGVHQPWALQQATAPAVANPQQAPPQGAPQQGGQPQQGAPSADHGGFNPFGIVAYPDRPKAPQEVLDRGKAAYSVSCAFCHGSDAGGGSTGPNLLRSEVVLQDKNGEAIQPIVDGSRASRGMPKIDISAAQVGDIAAWLHSLPVTSRSGHEKINIVVGNASAGVAAFNRLCASCHSVTGDLKGFAAKFTDPRDMQQAWIMPGMRAFRIPGMGGGGPPVELKVPPTTATVTDAHGVKVTGVLDSVDEFLVTITPPGSKPRTWTRTDGVPQVEIHDPLAPHRDMLRTYRDKDIHDITAYLLSLK
jgi:mono/diheme cytochrome c family protein